MPSESLFDKIRTLGHLTPSEAKIAGYLDRTYPLLALETVTSISENAEVGRATVVRFISRLGYDSFSDFQNELKKDLLSRIDSPAEKYVERKTMPKGRKTEAFRTHCDQVIRNLHEAARRIDAGQVEACARLLATCKGSIYIMGSRTSFSLAHLFSLQLSYLRDGIVLLDNLGGSLPNQVRTVSGPDLLIGIFKTRYSRLTEQAAHWFKQKGCCLILLTDRETNPLANLADIQFVAPSDGISIFDSSCATLAVLETLVDLVALQYDKKIDRLLVNVETAFDAFETFSFRGQRQPKKMAAKRPRQGIPGRSHENR